MAYLSPNTISTILRGHPLFHAPLLLVPTLFFFSSLSISKKEKKMVRMVERLGDGVSVIPEWLQNGSKLVWPNSYSGMKHEHL